MRANHDAIITTSKTVLKDDCILNCRISGLEKFSPKRFILDKNLKIPFTKKIIQTADKYKTYIFYNLKNGKKIKMLKRLKVNPIRINLKNNNLDFDEILSFLRKKELSRVFVEAGLEFNNFLLINNYINNFYHFYSNDLLKTKGFKNINTFLTKIKKNSNIKKKIRVNLLNDKLKKYFLK